MTINTKHISKVLAALAMTVIFGPTGGAKERGKDKSVGLPDLAIANALISKDPTGKFMENITVTVVNRCPTGAGRSYVLATFKESADPGAKSIYFVGQPVGALRGGSTITTVINVRGKKIGTSAFVLLEIDPYGKVPESDEANNSMTLNPKSPAAGTGGGRCQG